MRGAGRLNHRVASLDVVGLARRDRADKLGLCAKRIGLEDLDGLALDDGVAERACGDRGDLRARVGVGRKRGIVTRWR
jgi:hypothetical protein